MFAKPKQKPKKFQETNHWQSLGVKYKSKRKLSL